ncbi:MAG TPA: CoA transferase, partial [Candidatus Binatia bacterium]|nr:CoA transferase [Candidatus Binatia bacterium]
TERGLIKQFLGAPGVDREIAVVRSGFRLASGDPAPVTPPPALGADTDRILQELGYDRDCISKLRDEGVV